MEINTELGNNSVIQYLTYKTCTTKIEAPYFAILNKEAVCKRYIYIYTYLSNILSFGFATDGV